MGQKEDLLFAPLPPNKTSLTNPCPLPPLPSSSYPLVFFCACFHNVPHIFIQNRTGRFFFTFPRFSCGSRSPSKRFHSWIHGVPVVFFSFAKSNASRGAWFSESSAERSDDRACSDNYSFRKARSRAAARVFLHRVSCHVDDLAVSRTSNVCRFGETGQHIFGTLREMGRTVDCILIS